MKSRVTTIVRSLAFAASLVLSASAQTSPAGSYFFSTLAGTTGGPDALDGIGSAARFNIPRGVAVDSTGNLYVSDYMNHTIRKITPSGAVTTFAGTAGVNGSTDGPAATALFEHPMGLAIDRTGNLYVDDFGNCTIRKITPAGVVSTFAGTARAIGSTDGVGETARFNYPYDVALDDDGNLYVADLFNSCIRKIAPDRTVSTLTARDIRLLYPCSLALDAQKNIYVADLGLHTIAKITPTGTLSILAGISATQGSADGPGQSATFNTPNGITVDRLGNVYVSDTNNQTIRKITPDGTVTTFAGTKGSSDIVDGRGAAAHFSGTTELAADDSGNIYAVDGGAHSVRKITPDALVTTVAGAPAVAGASDGTGPAARFRYPDSVAVDKAGNTYVADTQNYAIRKISPDGNVTTFAGKPGEYGHLDGTGTEARFSYPEGIAVDQAGNVYVADDDFTVRLPSGTTFPSNTGSTIRKITPAGVVTTFAGTAGTYGNVDGSGTAARFNHPQGVAVDPTGNVYVCDTYNGTIRKITPAGQVSTFAHLNGLGNCIAVDGSGTVFALSDNTIYKFSASGLATPFVGSGSGISVQFSSRPGIAADAAGNLFVADSNFQTIRKITPAGQITTIAGKDSLTGNATGVGSDAHFNFPVAIAVDQTGNLLVANNFNHNIRKGQLAGAPVIATQPQSQTATAGGSVQFSVTAGGVPTPTYQWYFNGAVFSGATTNTLSFSNARTADAGDYTVVVSNSLGSVTSTKATLTVSSSSTPPPSSTPSSGGSTGGGGSITAWFVFALAALGISRRQFRSHS